MTLIDEYRRRGVAFAVDGDKLRVTAPAGTLTPVDRARLAEAKPLILAELRRMEYARRFRDQGPSVNEATAILIAVEREGICLTYCTALGDCVAFVASDADRRRVPPGFVVYTIDEIEMVYDVPVEKLRLIHAAKRAGGGRVLSVDPLEDGTGK
jgi:hypothetical protein